MLLTVVVAALLLFARAWSRLRELLLPVSRCGEGMGAREHGRTRVFTIGGQQAGARDRSQ